MNHLIANAKQMVLVETRRLIVNGRSIGYGRLVYRFDWLSADKIGWTMNTYQECNEFMVFRL